MVTVGGVLLVFLGPWAVRAVVALDALFVRLLLGPTIRGERLAELERTRAVAVDDSQARLVALAMNVGLAREK